MGTLSRATDASAATSAQLHAMLSALDLIGIMIGAERKGGEPLQAFANRLVARVGRELEDAGLENDRPRAARETAVIIAGKAAAR